MRRMLVAGAVVGLVAALGVAGPAQATGNHDPATVGLFHGIPKVPVDVYLGKTKIADDFQPGTFAGPLKVAPGTYNVRITAADATSFKDAIIGPKKVVFAAGKNYSVVARVTPNGKPTVTRYTNDLSPVEHGLGRVTVRHVASAPAVDVLVDHSVAVAGLASPGWAKARLGVGDHEVAVTLAGSSTPVLGPVTVKIAADTNTIVYAWGSAKDGTLALTTRVLPTAQH